MGKYEKLDADIVSMLGGRPIPVFDIWLRWREEVLNINVIDRRMQHLKKKGLVSNVRGKGWIRIGRYE